MAWVKQVNVRNLEFWNKKNLICFYESEKLKEEKEQKSVCKGGPFIRNGCSCIMLGTTMFTPEINMLCLVQADGVTVCPHAAIILYISWDFFYTTLQWMNFCWTFLFLHLQKHAGVFNRKWRKWYVHHYGVQYSSMELFFFSTFIRLIFSVLNVFAAENAMRVYTWL